MKDIKINNLKLNARNEISFKITVKEWDYSLQELELLKRAEINGDMLDINIVWLVNWDIEKQNKANLVKLNWIMLTYCEKAWINIEDEKQRLYKRYNITSRKQLLPWNIENEIESYKMWLIEFNL